MELWNIIVPDIKNCVNNSLKLSIELFRRLKHSLLNPLTHLHTKSLMETIYQPQFRRKIILC